MITADAIRKQLRHPDSDVRWDAVLQLEEMKGEEATGLAIEALNDGDFEGIRWLAAVILGKRRDPAAVGPLVEVLHDRNRHLRRAAIEALGAIGEPGAIGALIEMLRDPYLIVRIQAVRSLVQIGDPALVPLKRALGEGDVRFRGLVQEALDELEQKKR
jgi:HEAT repeat protein